MSSASDHRTGAASSASGFSWRLWHEAEAKQSWVCLGLDLDLDCLPTALPRTVEGARRFLAAVVDACVEDVAAFKPNLAHYAVLGAAGWELLSDVVQHISGRAIVIVDGKFGDVASTSERYARAMFDGLECDAVTVNPYVGSDGIEPLVARADRGAFVWARSSNPGADELQGLRLEGGEALYVEVARRVAGWDRLGNLGLVVGATCPRALAAVRRRAPRLPILAPGVGPQGGDLESTVTAGFGEAPAGVMVNLGRAALWASADSDYAAATLGVVRRMRDRINAAIDR